ncbi:MAG: 3-phosphoshikimate 1-carboxyvinyltransferase [Chloroflexota bacterium]
MAKEPSLVTVRPVRRLAGEVSPPGDKSISHRAVMFNALADGEAAVTNLAQGDDVRSTIQCLKTLGVSIKRQKDALIISGAAKTGLKEPDDVLNTGNSGTTIRLITGILAAQPFLSVITGDASLRSRPMKRIIDPLRQMGAKIWGRGDGSLAPLAIHGGQLKGIDCRLPMASAQVKSAVLLAALFTQGKTSVEEPSPSRDHTERMLRRMGARLQASGARVTLMPGRPLKSFSLRVPGDISSAAFWMVAAAISPEARITIRDCGVNPTRTGIIDVLKTMGARLKIANERFEGDEPVADITVESSRLKGVEISGGLIPRVIDEIPVLAVAACMAEGKTVIRDAAELRVKESDRIASTAAELSRLGARIEELPDGMVIYGGKRLEGAEVSSHLDHRLAMSLAVAGLVAKGTTSIHQADSVTISYPGFWDDLHRLSE